MKRQNNDLWSSRGFYIALYSCIFALLASAIAITYNSLASFTRDTQVVQEEVIETVEASARPNVEITSIDVGESMTLIRGEQLVEAPTPVETQRPAEVPRPTPAPTTPPTDLTLDEDTTFVEEDEAFEYVEADPVFATFNGEPTMMWPVFGEVVMNYSPTSVIFDVTLEQFRTNDSISIASNVGTTVRASADGIVREILYTREEGNKVILDHGNGWRTTYSQLDSDIIVEVGDVVVAGESLGTVAEPSIHRSLLGSHLNFRVAQEGNSVNPGSVLE